MINRLRLSLVIPAIVLFALAIPLLLSKPASAAYDGGRLIDDVLFLNSSTMSAQDIQNFLVAKGSGFAGMSFPFDCSSTGMSDPYYRAAGAPCGQTVPASTIIYYASQIYGINPQVVLATLQKEQGSITDPTLSSWQIHQAMGYGCPTTGSCSGSSSFLYQLDNGVWLLRFHRERANGNMGYWFQSTSWVCGTEKNFYKPNLYPGQNVNFYDEDGVYYRTHYIANAATSSMYCYTPHAYNNPQGLYGKPAYGSTGRYYSGSYNFVYWYEIWFGQVNGPAAFRISGDASGAIYIPFGTYRYVVPYAAAMQDYGISWEAVQTISQEAASLSPTPPTSTGYSQSIAHVVKTPSDSDADGGSIYLISRNKRYQIQSMQQFYNFGFKESELSYLPFDFIISKQPGGVLPNFVTEPRGSVFQVDDQGKHMFFEYDAYISRNPTDQTAAFSYYLADKISSGTPVTERPVLIKYSTGDFVNYYYQNSYYSVPTYDVYQCWGFETANRTPVYRLPQDDYIAPIAQSTPLDCTYSISSSMIMLTAGKKAFVSPALGLQANPANSSLTQLINRIPGSTYTLSPYVKMPGDAAVWYLANGKRRVIPTYNTFQIIGISDVNLHTISAYNLQQFLYDGFQLATGQTIKDSTSASVYVAGINKRFAFPTSDLFLAYKNSWGMIDTLNAQVLNENYPIAGVVSPWLKDKSTNKTYLIGNNGCYTVSLNDIQAFGSSQASIDNLPYSASDFRTLTLNSCTSATRFVRVPGQSLVYWIDSGKKYPIQTYDAMLQKNNGSEPTVMTLDSQLVTSLPTGDPIK